MHCCLAILLVASIQFRPGRPGESYLVETTTIKGTIDARYPEKKQISLFCPDGIPHLSTAPSSMRFSVVTDDFERDVPAVASIVTATLDVRTNGHFLRNLVVIGVDPKPRRIVAVPPPTPGELRWKAVKRFLSKAGAGLAILAFAAWSAWRAIAFRKRAGSVTGEIVAASSNEGWSQATVSFVSGGQSFEFTERQVASFKPRTRVEVLYMREDPLTARLGGRYLFRPTLFSAAVGIAALILGYA
jgi:hypothetical protein